MKMAAGNSVNDEIREQQAKLKGKPFKEKWDYFWNYYKVHTIVTILIIVAVSNLIYTIVTQKDVVMSVAFVNTYLKEEIDSEQMAADYGLYAGIDTNTSTAELSTNMVISYEGMDEMSYTNSQKLVAMTAAQSIDIIVADDNYLEHNMESGLFWDLTDFLPAQTLEKYADRLKYADLPDDDKGEVPYAIDISDSKYMLSDQLPAWFCVVGNAANVDNLASFLDFMMEP